MQKFPQFWILFLLAIVFLMFAIGTAIQMLIDWLYTRRNRRALQRRDNAAPPVGRELI
jgi:hypothetical protein